MREPACEQAGRPRRVKGAETQLRVLCRPGPPNSLWTLTGGDTTNHGDNNFNHWATSALSNGIFQTASDFLFEHPEVGQIALNDMALPIGGRFDIQQNWIPPHADHDRGLAVDVNLVPQSLANEFIEWCTINGARDARVEFNPYHIHCRW
jgi:hypothetical protein